MQKVRVGLIGLGYRGKYLFHLLKHIEGYEVLAIADPKCDSLDCNSKIRFYNKGLNAYQAMLNEEALDLVLISTPWHLQEKIACHCIKQNCHIALEIKGGLRLDEYTQLSELATKHNRKVFPLENTLFMQDVLAVKEMVRAGLFGDLVHLKGAYRHDLRQMLTDDKPENSAFWRKQYYEQTNGDLYPTHSFAPLCFIAGNKREDFISLNSFASASLGFQAFNPKQNKKVKTGDIIITHLEDKQKRLFTLVHDTSLPRPKALEYEVQGTKGIWQAEHRRIYIEGLSPNEMWEDIAPYLEQYKHRYWKLWGLEALRIDEHHQGMDYVMLMALLSDLNNEITYPAKLADLRLWCSITPLSAKSIQTGSKLFFLLH